MEYTVKGLADLAGVTARTLRWYDREGLLKPARISESGYRMYGESEVWRLQQILFYRELEMPLSKIKAILDSPGFDRREALQSHLLELQKRRERMDALILTVNKTLNHLQGGIEMSDQEKFEAFRANAVRENEQKYGKEIRERYGDEAVDSANAAFGKLSKEEYAEWKQLEGTILGLLRDAVLSGKAPDGPEGTKIAELHGRWCFCTLGEYDAKKHAGIAEMYVQDERFTAYYDKAAVGCARFLRDAVAAYTARR